MNRVCGFVFWIIGYTNSDNHVFAVSVINGAVELGRLDNSPLRLQQESG